ncbi:MAG TPA: glutaredoxin 2 [Bacteriovoracaceae bacterium]|nr:glutaredoxin 2 [Bacteriovoracaceae bacterium]
MSLTLYHYVHCPFCVRVRMTLGLLQLEYKSEVLAYNDETTPVNLTGKKMLPILKHDQGAMNESLDIMTFLDKGNLLKIEASRTFPEFGVFEAYLTHLGSMVHPLAMPYWMWTPEFDPTSRRYFQKTKEDKRGPFKDLVKKQPEYFEQLKQEMPKLEQELVPFYKSEKLTVHDIMLASHLWGLYTVPEFQFSPNVHDYLQSVKQQCDFNYHQDYWV